MLTLSLSWLHITMNTKKWFGFARLSESNFQVGWDLFACKRWAMRWQRGQDAGVLQHGRWKQLPHWLQRMTVSTWKGKITSAEWHFSHKKPRALHSYHRKIKRCYFGFQWFDWQVWLTSQWMMWFIPLVTIRRKSWKSSPELTRVKS